LTPYDRSKPSFTSRSKWRAAPAARRDGDKEIFRLAVQFSVDPAGAFRSGGLMSSDSFSPRQRLPVQPTRSGGDRRGLQAPPRRAAPGAAGQRDRQAGFTLLELLVVLAIIGLLVGLVAPAALHQLGSAKEKITHQSIERLASVLDMYKLDVGGYPTTDQGLQALITAPHGVTRWNGPYMKGSKIPEDPWGRPFQYQNPSQRPGHDFDLYSLGPAGQTGGTQEAPIYNE
jgi:general secretion pathway protein G